MYLRILAYCREVEIIWLHRAQSDPSQWINTLYLQKIITVFSVTTKLFSVLSRTNAQLFPRGTYKLEDLLQVKISLGHSAFPCTHLPFHAIF